MRKSIYLILILLVSLTVNAALTLRGPAPEPILVQPGVPFQMVVSGLSSDVPQVVGGAITGGLYPITSETYSYDPEDWHVDWLDATVTPAAGNFGSTNFVSEYGGFDFVVGDITAGAVQDGDWIVYTYVINEPYTTVNFDLYDYDVGGYYVPIQRVQVSTPEPMTLSLLAFGGLLAARRRAIIDGTKNE